MALDIIRSRIVVEKWCPSEANHVKVEHHINRVHRARSIPNLHSLEYDNVQEPNDSTQTAGVLFCNLGKTIMPIDQLIIVDLSEVLFPIPIQTLNAVSKTK